MEAVRVGCSGWAYKEWRGEFYPPKLPQREWLRHYSERFGTVEVNNTFYRLPSEDAVNGWLAETPDDFAFTIKGSRYTTHIKRLLSPEKYTVKFFEAIRPIADAGKLACVLWQLPPSFKADHERLAGLMAVLERQGGRHAIEFRHPSWFTPTTYDVLREYDVALVCGDDPDMAFREVTRTASWAYVRFHRSSRGRSAPYPPRELETWRRRIAAWRSTTEVLAYFNNEKDAQAHAAATSLARSFA